MHCVLGHLVFGPQYNTELLTLLASIQGTWDYHHKNRVEHFFIIHDNDVSCSRILNNNR
jgi:hypothetical protein